MYKAKLSTIDFIDAMDASFANQEYEFYNIYVDRSELDSKVSSQVANNL